MINRPIIVTGCARSGTSMIAGILHLCGAWIGECTGSTRWNKKGQFENIYIRDGLTKPFLKSISCDPLGQDPLPDTGKIQELKGWEEIVWNWRRRVLQAMKGQGYSGREPWMFKGAKACLIWPVWHAAFPEAKWVVVRRPDEQVVQSCLNTSFMRKRKTAAGWQAWVDHHKCRFREMEEAGLWTTEIWSDGIIAGDLSAIESMVRMLDLQWNGESARQFVDRRLWHGSPQVQDHMGLERPKA